MGISDYRLALFKSRNVNYESIETCEEKKCRKSKMLISFQMAHSRILAWLILQKYSKKN